MGNQMTDFNPNSMDAQLARIITNQEAMDRKIDENHAHVCGKIDGLIPEVEDLKRWKWMIAGVAMIISLAIGFAAKLMN